MQRKALWIFVGAAGILGTGRLIHDASEAERASALAASAERLLAAPFEQAPGFQELRATEARLLLEEAEELAATSDTRRLWVTARAIELLQRGDADGARQELVQSFPEPPDELRVLRAAVELADQQPSAAGALLDPLLEGAAVPPRALALASDIARAEGRADRALELAERGVASRPSAPMYERRGLAHELAGDLPAARDDLAKAAQLDPRPSAPLLHLGRVQQALGDSRGAVLAFSAAAQRNPREPEAWLGSGICRMSLGDRSGARNDLERAEELAPTRAAPLIGLGDLDTAELSTESAERRYRAATQLEPAVALGWLKLGNTLMRRGEASAAANAYRNAIERKGELAAAHNGLGAALQAQGKLDEARVELERAARLDASDPNPLLNLARLHRKRGDLAAAEAALAQAHSRAPELAGAASLSSGSSGNGGKPARP